MRDWREKLDAFLRFNEHEILGHAGKVSMEVARSLALSEYGKFNARRLADEAAREALEDDEELARIEKRLIEGKEDGRTE